MNTKQYFLTSVVAFVFAGGITDVAALQVTDDVTSKAADVEADMIEIIEVTARNRSESLQNIPLSIVALNEAMININKISNLDDVARFTPGFTMNAGLGLVDARPAIRGQSNIRAASQPTVGIFIDGIDLPYRSGLNSETLDIARIEVVKGPQSALFGRGVLSGAINYITLRPRLGEVSGYFEGELASDDLYEVRGRINLPVNSTFAVALSARHSDFDGAFVNNKTGANTIGGQEIDTVVASALWEPSDTFSAYLRLENSDETRESPPRHIIQTNTQTGDAARQRWYVGVARADADLITCDCDEYASLERKFTRASLALDWDLEFGSVSSLTGLTKTDILLDQDNDFDSILVNGGPPFLGNWRAIIKRDIETFSQEVRFASPDEDRFNWIVGVYYYEQTNDESGQDRFGLIPEPRITDEIFQSDETNTYALFGQASYEATDKLTLSAELRWNRDELSTEGTVDGMTIPLDESFDNWLPRFSMAYKATDDILFYASVAKGSKPGGFNTALGAGGAALPLELIAFDEEQALSYEVGVKSTLLDRRLTANAAIFYVDWTDIQIDDTFVGVGGTTGFTSNAGEGRVKGFEFYIDAKASNSINLSLGYSYNPGEVLDPNDRRAAGAGIDTTGWRILPYTSEHSATAAIRWQESLDKDWDIFVSLDSRFDSTQFATVANLAETGDQFTSNLRVGLDNDSWSVQGYVTNLFDSNDTASLTPFVNLNTFARQFLVTVRPPRQVGVKVRYNF
jgi:iron complex outermembrane receptor protein